MSAQSANINPFPTGTVVTETGVRLVDFRGDSWQRAVRLIDVYRENYFASPPGPGLAMGIRGRFGSGKTHLAFQLQDGFARAPLIFRTVYAKIDRPNFLELYKLHFAPKLIEQLTDVAARHLAKLLRLSTGSGLGDDASLSNIAQKAVDDALASSPERVLELVKQDLLPVTGLSQALDAEIEGTASDLTGDFFRAYTRLREPTWSKVAIRWFEGDALTPEERDDLGLRTLQISQPDQARKAMRFMLEAHRKADVAVLLCLDEFERFAVRGLPEDLRSFPGFLKDLAEMFESTGNVFLLSGAEGAWRQLTGDTFDRIRRERIIEMKLTDSEAEGLLALYCENSGRNVATEFDPGAIQFLIELSERNARRMLNVSHGAFGITEGRRRISEQDLRKAASEALADDQRFQSMDENILRIAGAQGLAVKKHLPLSSTTAVYELSSSPGQAYYLIVVRSSFKHDEGAAGRSAAATAEELRKKQPASRTAMIVLGYSTEEVRHLLEHVSDAVLTYDEDRFSAELANFLRTSPAPPIIEEARSKAFDRAVIGLEDIDNKRTEDFNRLATQIQAMEAALRERSGQEREQRVTDKIAASIAELQELLKKEQVLTEDVMRNSRPGDVLWPRDKITTVLDSERAIVRRLALLNDGLPEASTVRPVLIKIMEEADAWESRLPPAEDDLLGVRAQYRERQATLSELELRHTRRMRREMNLFGWKVSSRYLALAFLGLAGIVFDTVVLFNGASENNRLLDAYYSSLVTSRSALSQITATPLGTDLAAAVLKDRAQLDVSFVVAQAGGVPVSQLIALHRDLINDMARVGGNAANSDSAVESRYRIAADGVNAVDKLLALRPQVLWSTLVARWVWLTIGLLPSFIAVELWSLSHMGALSRTRRK